MWEAVLANQFSSVTQLCLTFCSPMGCSMPGFPVHHQLPELTQTRVHWVGDAIQPSHPSVIPFSSCLQSLPASGSFLMSQLFASGGQSFRASVSAAVLLMNIQNWFPLELTVLVFQSKGHSRVFYNTTAQKNQFFNAQPSLWSNFTSIHLGYLSESNKCYFKKAISNISDYGWR